MKTLLNYFRNKPTWRPWYQHYLPFVSPMYGITTYAASCVGGWLLTALLFVSIPLILPAAVVASFVHAVGRRLYLGRSVPMVGQ